MESLGGLEMKCLEGGGVEAWKSVYQVGRSFLCFATSGYIHAYESQDDRTILLVEEVQTKLQTFR